MTVFKEGLRRYQKGTLVHEDLMAAFVQFVTNPIYQQSSSFPYPPSKVRKVLYDAMEIYPTNTLFLATFIEGEIKSQIAGRIRTYFDQVLEK